MEIVKDGYIYMYRRKMRPEKAIILPCIQFGFCYLNISFMVILGFRSHFDQGKSSARKTQLPFDNNEKK